MAGGEKRSLISYLWDTSDNARVMATRVSKTYVRRRKGKREEQDDEAADFEGIGSWKGERSSEFIVEHESASKLELDVAEALAEFCRTAHEQAQRGKFDVGLRWSRKRIRSSLVIKESNPACDAKEEPEDAFSSAKKSRSSCAFGRDSSLSDRDEIDSTRMSKEYSHFESRAQSPTSPLLSLRLPCGTLLPFGTGAKSAFRRVLPLVPLQRPILHPVKSEIVDIPLEVPTGRPESIPFQKKTKHSKHRVGMAAVKMESVEEQTMGGTDDQKKALIPEESRVKSEANWVPSLSVSTKPKSALSDKKEKEARRLRRIQANRESARQTIRKKQVVCQELIKKASSLTVENEGLKQKRESLLQDLFSLKGQNYYLKHQLQLAASIKLDNVAVELPPQMVSESVSVSPLQGPSSHYAGVIAHTSTWAVPAEQAAVTKEPYTFNGEDTAMNASLSNLVPHQWEVLPSNKETSGLEVQEQNLSHVFDDDVCSPSTMERCQKEISPSIPSCTPHCEGQSPTTAFSNPDMADDQAEKSACQKTSKHGNCTVSQPPLCAPCSQTGSNTMPAGVVAYQSMDPFKRLQITQGIKGGYSHDGSRSEYFIGTHSQTNALMARNYFAAMAAAEARKKRKELSRHKFLRCRGLRRPKTIVADKTREP